MADYRAKPNLDSNHHTDSPRVFILAMMPALLTGKSARIIVTMGMPALAYRWYFGAHRLRSLERNILGFSGVRPIRESLFGMIESVSDKRRKVWLEQMCEKAQRDA